MHTHVSRKKSIDDSGGSFDGSGSIDEDVTTFEGLQELVDLGPDGVHDLGVCEVV